MLILLALGRLLQNGFLKVYLFSGTEDRTQELAFAWQRLCFWAKSPAPQKTIFKFLFIYCLLPGQKPKYILPLSPF